jgi:pre-rRNA-processing protein TSR3
VRGRRGSAAPRAEPAPESLQRTGAAELAVPDVLILRDPRESRAKCSLTPLRGQSGVRFVEYRPERRIAAGGRLLLDPEGELLGPSDRGHGLLVLDCSWRRLPSLRRVLDGEPRARRLPPLATGYPRRSKRFADPLEGLASIEALYAALTLLGWSVEHLLESYPWREAFLERNPALRASS